MAFTLSDLRNSRNDFASLQSALKKTGTYAKDEDNNFFKLERDKTGNGSAVIRFLPKHDQDDLPWVSIYSHAFQGPGARWYIENSRTTIGDRDPVSELNASLWATGIDADKEVARKQKRRLHYIANVLIISNPAKPELEGSVMAYKFGKKIFEKLTDTANPTFPDDPAINPFDPINGANFKLRMRQVEGYPNYDKSEFSEAKAISDSEDAILDVLNQIKPLKDYVSPDKFKSYDELKTKLDSVLSVGAVRPNQRTAETLVESINAMPIAAPKVPGRVTPEPTVSTKSVGDDTDDDSIEDYFKNSAT